MAPLKKHVGKPFICEKKMYLSGNNYNKLYRNYYNYDKNPLPIFPVLSSMPNLRKCCNGSSCRLLHVFSTTSQTVISA